MMEQNNIVAQGGISGEVQANQPGQDLVDSANAKTEQFITFTIGDEEYGVDIMAVREIKGWIDTTILPNTPKYMRGVLNLRGVIVPIFDLRCRFGLGLTDATTLHVVVIIAISDRMIGILVDAVSDILSVSTADIRNVPKMDLQIDDQFLSGLVTVDERMVALLDANVLFSADILEDSQQAIASNNS